MQITWTISHSDRQVTATLGKALEPGDVENFLSEIAACGGMPYAKLVDLRFTPAEARLAELKAMMRSTEQYAKSFVLGPIALLVDSDFAQETSTLYGERTKVSRPLRIFREMPEAKAWLMKATVAQEVGGP